MKKKALYAVAALCMVLAACGKEHQCKCTTTDVPDDGLLKLMTIDGGMSCDDIHTMGYEVHVVDSTDGSHSLVRIEMHEVSCRDYAD